jgi:hypothetical protein
VSRTWCRDISDPQDSQQCSQAVREDASYIWDYNRQSVFYGQMYCRDLRSSCEDDCDQPL